MGKIMQKKKKRFNLIVSLFELTFASHLPAIGWLIYADGALISPQELYSNLNIPFLLELLRWHFHLCEAQWTGFFFNLKI